MTDPRQTTETLISVAVLRAICGAAPGEIEGLARARLLTVRAGKVGLVAGVRAYLDGIRASTKSASLSAAQDASRAARADTAELALAVDDRRLVRQVEAEEAIASICGAIMSRSFTIAARATRDVRERRHIEAVITAAQQQIAAAVAAADHADDLAPARPAARRRATR